MRYRGGWSARESGGTGLRGDPPIPTVEPDPGHAGAGSVMIAIVGGGVIGLSVAWRLTRAGHEVTLIDPAPMSGGSWVAAGMLAPVAEAWPGEEGLLTIG